MLVVVLQLSLLMLVLFLVLVRLLFCLLLFSVVAVVLGYQLGGGTGRGSPVHEVQRTAAAVSNLHRQFRCI